jgi:chromosome segregation ATPase
MNQNLFHTLMQFHREIALPDMQRLIDKQTELMNARFDHVYKLFDGVFGKLEGLDSEMVALKGGLARLEARLTDVESRLTSVESELQFVKSELGRLERWRSDIETRFDASEQNAARDAKLAEINEQLEIMNARIAALETRQ